MTVEDRGIDYSPILNYFTQKGIAAQWSPLKEHTQEELFRVVEGADAVIAGVERWDFETMYQVSSHLKIIARYGIGYETVDIKAAKQLGIVVTNTPVVLSEAVAELALALYFDLSRFISKSNEQLHNGKWESPSIGHNIEGKTVGIIGFGAIGRRFAEILGSYHCRLLAFDPFFNEKEGKRLKVERVSMEDLILQSDCISLHLPTTPATIGLVDKEFLKQMKKTAFLINTSRGALVNEQDLVDALTNGIIAGAAIDVYREEPLPEKNIFRGTPNLIMTPHIASATEESFLKAGMLAAESVVDALEGRIPKHVVKEINGGN